MSICTIQVTNLCPKATYRQMKELFSYLGEIDELRLFPEDETKINIPSKVCFVTFKERSSVETALHLSNTIFVDRSIIIAQSPYEVIPDESVAMSLAAPAVAVAYINKKSLLGSGINSSPLLPTPQKSLLGTPQMLPNPLASAVQQAQAVATTINANIQSNDEETLASHGITGNVDPSKIDEIRRTIYVGNVSSNLHADQVMNFFQTCGEIRYVRMAGDETQPTRFAFVEFSSPESVQIALQYNGAMFGDRPIKVNHSKNAIVKPQGKAPQVAQREVDAAMRKVRQAGDAITNVIEPGKEERDRDKKSRTRSRSRSRDRRRSRDRKRRRSRSPSYDRHRKRTPSRSPRRSRNYSPRRESYKRHDRRSRSHTPPPRHYHSRSHRHRSPERERRRYSRSYSRSRSPSPPPRQKSSSSSSKKRREKERDRGRERDNYSVTPSPSPERKRSSKKSKKEKKHRSSKKSPSSSPTPSPPPRNKKDDEGIYSDPSGDHNSDDRHSSPSASD